ncbi:hypothetical protein C5F53_14055 [Rhodoferax sp. TS-BS-61-7]|nr:hypothetical protein C5F53_14055 [Rhodoferax sp. TS-BS-61-7]
MLLDQWAETVLPLLMMKFLSLSKEKVGDEATRIDDNMETWLHTICPGMGLPHNFIDVDMRKTLKYAVKRGAPLSFDLLG